MKDTIYQSIKYAINHFIKNQSNKMQQSVNLLVNQSTIQSIIHQSIKPLFNPFVNQEMTES